MHVVLTGAYGMGNLGDEAIAAMAIRHLLDVVPNPRITLLVWDDTRRWSDAHRGVDVRALPGLYRHALVRPRLWSGLARAVAAIAGCDVLVWGGGRLVRDRSVWLREYLWSVRLAAFLHKRIVVLAVGADPITDPSRRRALRVLRDADAISVRDFASKENLVQAIDGIPPVDVVSDGVFAWPVADRVPPPVPTLGITLRNLTATGDADVAMPRWLVTLSDVLRSMQRDRPFRIVCLPTATKELALSRAFCLLDRDRELVDARTPGDYLQHLSRCTAFVGMRLHACILASRVRGLPVRCFAPAPKTMDAFRECGAEASAFTVQDVSTDAFRASLIRALAGDVADEPAFTCGAGKMHPRDWLRSELVKVAATPRARRSPW